MFFRRKNADGFDWHKYVRTTVLLRRKQRRARLEEIGRVAADQVKAAGDAAVHGVIGAAEQGRRASFAAWQQTIARPAVAFPLTLCGIVALISGLYRWVVIAHDGQALLPLALGIVVLLLVAPLAIAGIKDARNSLPGLRSVALSPNALSVVAICAMALGLGWFAWGGATPDLVGASAMRTGSTVDGNANVLEGRATALSGEMIRLQGRLLHLSGIEAPDQLQTCQRASRQPWKCGEAALAALERLSRTKAFRCVTQGGPDAIGRTEASCTVEGRDVAGELVKDGHVFSSATYFGGYASLEAAARRAGSGIWAGEAERPADFRAKLWSAAKAAAPDGCPIKGRVSSGRKTYLMPWSQGYNEATVRANRSDRWFCDEAEALNAGFKSADDNRRSAAK